jgi:type II secretory pathway predicted ATPase ExeA
VLVGQPEVRQNLRRPELRQLVQRISVDYHLSPLTRRETLQYVTHRLRVAGSSRPIFTGDAFDVIYRHSGGIPRVINSLCDFSLTFAAVDQRCTIDASVVQEVVDEKRRQGLFWMEPEHYQLEPT